MSVFHPERELEVAVSWSVWKARTVKTSREEFILFEVREASVPSKIMRTGKCVRTFHF